MAKKISRILLYVIVTLGAITMLIPFLWMVSTSLKTSPETIKIPPVWIPKVLQWHNYVEAFNAAPFARYFINSVIVTVVTTVGQLFTSILAAFAFSRLHFWGKNLLFMLFLGTMMIPGEMLIIPNFVTLSKIGLIDHYGALIVPWLASFFTVFTLRQAFQSTPEQIYYAAKMDGATDWKYLWTVLVPMSKSTITAVTVLSVIGSWNSFMWPLIVTNSENMRTLPVGLQAFTTDAGTQYQLLMAASTFVIIPMVIVYIFLQKYIIAGISKAGLKG
ncbi:MAG: carbohydrate ABC transporter permease [Lactobacillus sp.]|jgi:multiple sugar transport system permease protein|uniref:Carbohydrate ABC transporter permease n=1 Tax=Lacticaseibacillus suilingensis TaxID=2799577 RepID=A0ABW4BGH5_9LACO|nr:MULTISPECIES: carbohydrate ABC transporter permease [Lacticaseibacillus]MCI1894109.1 carbohydrate ABC transporter permease [Lactobacillus sp.]MCI1918467.1 carbohydrate ABC transporter permease [Lactobacillus sp.]MCI1941425.1 carbohydrate ABC transporter permease [Lactobacillus sp.]MCI1972064.1 carbohydrate ABC transporter permease [Lactobacillus sp.]MCI2016093.1 carbohydrate ABC transporter permease [Lactobacillus sp.]